MKAPAEGTEKMILLVHPSSSSSPLYCGPVPHSMFSTGSPHCGSHSWEVEWNFSLMTKFIISFSCVIELAIRTGYRLDSSGQGRPHEWQHPFFSRVKADLMTRYSNIANSICSELYHHVSRTQLPLCQENTASGRMKRIQKLLVVNSH